MMQKTMNPTRRPNKLGSIRESSRWLKEAGYPISENAVRTWVKTKAIKAVYSGNKALVLYQDLLDYLGVQATEEN